MTKLLLDANLSPETREYLIEAFSFDVIDLITENKSGLSDEEIVLLAKKGKRIIVTFDLDFWRNISLQRKRQGRSYCFASGRSNS